MITAKGENNVPSIEASSAGTGSSDAPPQRSSDTHFDSIHLETHHRQTFQVTNKGSNFQISQTDLKGEEEGIYAHETGRRTIILALF